jgi:hypothetical protein
LRRLYGPKRKEVAGGCSRLHNEELHNLYASPSIRVIKSRIMRWAEHVAHMRDPRNAYNVLVGKYEGKSPLRRPRCRWEDNIRIDCRDIGWQGVEWPHLTQERDQWWALVNTVMNLKVL